VALVCRRAFDSLRSDFGQVEAGLALGFRRRWAIDNVINRHAAATRVLVLVGLLAAETMVVVASTWLIADGRILSADLRDRLPDA
jgi:hypothetical protein